jgi:hypothetical protein
MLFLAVIEQWSVVSDQWSGVSFMPRGLVTPVGDKVQQKQQVSSRSSTTLRAGFRGKSKLASQRLFIAFAAGRGKSAFA